MQEHVRYYRTPGGAIGEIRESHPGSTPLPEGAVELTEQEWQQEMADWQAAKDAHVADLRAADAARQQEDYEALRAAGLPEATARRLSGFQAE
jgi:hypothetical protein